MLKHWVFKKRQLLCCALRNTVCHLFCHLLQPNRKLWVVACYHPTGIQQEYNRNTTQFLFVSLLGREWNCRYLIASNNTISHSHFSVCLIMEVVKWWNVYFWLVVKLDNIIEKRNWKVKIFLLLLMIYFFLKVMESVLSFINMTVDFWNGIKYIQ
jgi:hypothetical protein